MTAIGFTGPIFIMIGAYLFFNEPMRWERWLAAGIGFVGVLIVVGPKLSGSGGFYHLVMLASAPMFAASFLLTKALTRYETTGVILVWQSLTVTIFSLPLALLHWRAPSAWQWAASCCAACWAAPGHYCLTRSFRIADISSTQSVKFLDLVWAALIGWMLFADVPSSSTLIGGVVICAATIWIATPRIARPHAQRLNRMRSPGDTAGRHPKFQPLRSRPSHVPLHTFLAALCLAPTLALAQMASAPFDGRLKKCHETRRSTSPTAPTRCPSPSRTTTRSPPATRWTCAAASSVSSRSRSAWCR